MIYSGKISDSKGFAIPGAAITFSTDTGERVASLPVSPSGAWSLDTEFDNGLLQPGMIANFTAPGYYNYGITASQLTPSFTVSLIKKVNGLAAVGIGAAALLLLAKPGKIFGIKKLQITKKQALIGAGVLIGGFALYKLFGPDARSQQSSELSTTAANDLNKVIAAGIMPTISPTEAESISSAILQAADQCGTDESAIYNAFTRLYNIADTLLLIKTYGVRQYRACFDGFFFQDTPRNLAETLSAELSSSEMAVVNDILATKGINYKF